LGERINLTGTLPFLKGLKKGKLNKKVGVPNPKKKGLTFPPK